MNDTSEELVDRILNNTYDILDGDFTIYNDYERDEGIHGDISELPVLDFLKLIFVIGSRVGYLLIQTGSIPVANVYVIVYHNVIETAVAAFSFGIFGIMVSSGFNSAKYSVYWAQWNRCISARAATGLSAVLIGTAQMSTFLVGRIHLGGAIILTVLYSAFYQPLLMYLVWPADGILINFTDNKGVTGLFTVVAYIPSTVVGLVGTLFLGRRLVRVKDVDEFSVANEHAIGAPIGYLLIIYGYCILSLPVQDDDCHKSTSHDLETPLPGKVLMFNILAAAVGITFVSILYYAAYRNMHKFWLIQRSLQGGIAGLMTVSAANYTVVWKAFIVAFLGAFLFYLLTQALHNTAMEDWCNMTASHLVPGFFGAMIWPIFMLLFNKNVLYHILYTGAVAVASAVFAIIVFLILKVAGILRNKYEAVDNKRAKSVLSHLPNKGYLERLFMMVDNTTPHIIPGSCMKKFIQESEQNLACREAKTLSFSRNIKGRDSRRNRARKTDLKEDEMMINENKKLLFPLSVEPLKLWGTSGSGDYYNPLL